MVKVLLISDSQQVVRDTSFSLKARYPDVIIIPTGEGRKGIEINDPRSVFRNTRVMEPPTKTQIPLGLKARL